MGLFDFFKSHNKEIRSQLEWRKNGFHPMFEEVARYIVSKKNLSQNKKYEKNTFMMAIRIG